MKISINESQLKEDKREMEDLANIAWPEDELEEVYFDIDTLISAIDIADRWMAVAEKLNMELQKLYDLNR